MRRIHVGTALHCAGVTWLMAPLADPLNRLGIVIFVMSLPVCIAGVSELPLVERIAAIKYSFAMTFIGITLYGLITFPGNEIVTTIGVILSNPWLVAVYQGIGSSGIFIATISLFFNTWEADRLFSSHDEEPSDPKEF